MEQTHAKSQTQPTRGTEIGTLDSEINAQRQTRIGRISQTDGSISGGASGALGEKSSFLQTIAIAGKILDRLITKTKSQLEEAQQCVVWYQNQENKLQAELRELEELAEIENETNQDQPGNED